MGVANNEIPTWVNKGGSMSKLRRKLLPGLLLLGALILAACGGSSSPPSGSGSSNWDEMVWDQDNWA